MKGEKITALDVMRLRERSGAPLPECKKALRETDNDEDKAFEWLKKNWSPIAKLR